MQTINLQKIINSHGLEAKDLAKKLFPTNKHPTMALKRVYQGEGVLDADQISLLSSLTGLPVSALFDLSQWKGEAKGEVLTFIAEGFRAELDMASGVSVIYHEGSVFHETLLHSMAIPLKEYLTEITSAVEKYKSKKLIK